MIIDESDEDKDDSDDDSDDESHAKRGNWSGKIDFFLSCLGYAVGKQVLPSFHILIALFLEYFMAFHTHELVRPRQYHKTAFLILL